MIARVRLGVAVVAGLVAAAIASALAPWQVTELVGWDVAAAVWSGSVWRQILGKDAAATQALATVEDDSRAASEAILLAASVASLVGVALALVKAASEKGAGHAGITALA